MWKASSQVFSADSVLVGVGGVRVDRRISLASRDIGGED